MVNMRIEFPPTPAMNYFSSEDAPLLGDFLNRTMSGDTKGLPRLHHGHVETHFDVGEFPDTPLLQDCSDDEFSDFVESPGSEVPPTLETTESSAEEIPDAKLKDLPTSEYIQHVAIIILVQLLIPIPFMLPMGCNFTKRSLKVFLPGFALGILGHALIRFLNKPTEIAPFDHLHDSLANPAVFLPALYAQFKVAILGGFVTGAVMSHVLNLCILGHTLCRLSRGLEPQPKAMRRAMDASKVFQFLQRFVLDLVTGVAMLPVGAAVRDWFYGKQFGVAGLPGDSWHSAATGVLGTIAVQLYLATHPSTVQAPRPVSPSRKHD
ncbi:hypothetical protein BDY19DRAFT_353905 [Irpex rosettiformis]|uniref:Uncharacterized protein n=1 Tax=Irpex rosettiformis TaxID=378272 RepID=A0ACB8TW59_9APHY|nr:hypothetical protein BDY19DRAFT_353905 [Irpex rosettiformis]